MNLKARRAARKARKNQEAWDRLHGKGAVSVPPRRRDTSAWFDSDDAGDLIVDILCALPRLILWVATKLFD
jgi:hypothetical protein